MAFQGVGTGFNITASSSAAAGVCMPLKTQYVRVVTGIATAHVAFGTDPTAAATDTVVTNQQPEIISIQQPHSAVFTEATIPSNGDAVTGFTTITLAQGYGHQFTLGSLVGLTVQTGTGSTQDQTYWNLSDLIVTNVQTLNRGNNYVNKLTLSGASIVARRAAAAGGINTALTTGNTLLARSAFKASAYTGGVEGTVYIQPVQISGG